MDTMREYVEVEDKAAKQKACTFGAGRADQESDSVYSISTRAGAWGGGGGWGSVPLTRKLYDEDLFKKNCL